MNYIVQYFIDPGMEDREQDFADTAEHVLSQWTDDLTVTNKRLHKWFDIVALKTRVKHVWETEDG